MRRQQFMVSTDQPQLRTDAGRHRLAGNRARLWVSLYITQEHENRHKKVI